MRERTKKEGSCVSTLFQNRPGGARSGQMAFPCNVGRRRTLPTLSPPRTSSPSLNSHNPLSPVHLSRYIFCVFAGLLKPSILLKGSFRRVSGAFRSRTSTAIGNLRPPLLVRPSHRTHSFHLISLVRGRWSGGLARHLRNARSRFRRFVRYR